MPLYTDALIADTGDMTAAEFGAYMRLLVAMWRNGGRLVNEPEQLARIAGCYDGEWNKVAKRVMRPMTIAGGEISQKRLTKTFLEVRERRRKMSAAGYRGAEKRWKTKRG